MSDQNRRSFLARSALGAGALIIGAPTLGAGCGGARPMPELGGRDADELTARLERGLAAARDLPPGSLARRWPGIADPERAEQILRTTLGGLVVADVARSVPDRVSLPPELTSRLAGALPLIGRSAGMHRELLSDMPAEARRRVGAGVRARPDAVMEIAEWIDEQGRALGIAAESRAKLRGAAADVGIRLRRQSASAVIDDAVAKVDRVVGRSGASLSLERSVAVAAMIEGIWQDWTPGGGGLGSGLSAPSGTFVADSAAASRRREEDEAWRAFTEPERDPRWSARWARPGDEERQIGLIMLPFGAISCGLFLIIGLIVLITGWVQNSSWDGRSRAELEGL